ncbi:hypothetical protein [Streptomyces sp. NPDC056883]|uniref:hypothetical protein n=1 Tax=Streptomyces sp. NPDC056883 TaxID=3345959 RepID=UPI0036BB9F30
MGATNGTGRPEGADGVNGAQAAPGNEAAAEGGESGGPAKSRAVTRLKVLAVAAAGVGVLVAGGLLAPKESPATLRANWAKVPRSEQQPVYSGPEPTQAMVWEDLDVVTADAEVGPDAGEGNPLREAWGDCAADYVSFEPVSDQQLTGLVNGLVARGWTIDSRMTEPVLAYALEKGGWKLNAFAKAPTGRDYFSLLALKETPECEERFEEHEG